MSPPSTSSLRSIGPRFTPWSTTDRDREDASDLTADAFIKSFQSINRFQGQSVIFHLAVPDRGHSTLTHLPEKPAPDLL